MKVAVLLSGGVDSSVALHQVKKDGNHQITAYYLKIWLEDDVSFLGECPWEEDLGYARAVCEQADVELKILPLQLEYYDKVVSYALNELKRGRTPSPDIFCNQRIKFGAFFDSVDEEYDRVVTGHYAWIEKADGSGSDGGYHLYQAPDPVKDQSYFLSHLSQDQISRLWFPLGHMQKSEVRRLAEELDLPNKNRKDSQGICFLGKVKYPDFVRHYLGERDGEIVRRETGEVLGHHKGFWFHTIGQRSGLGLGNGPWYVVDKDPDANIVYVSHKDDVQDAFHRDFIVSELTWIADRAPEWLSEGQPPADLDTEGSPPADRKTEGWPAADSGTGVSAVDSRGSDGSRFSLKLRHGPAMTGCRVEIPGRDELLAYGIRPAALDDGDQRLLVRMEEGDKGLAPGQFAVFYVGTECIGSGKIERAVASAMPGTSDMPGSPGPADGDHTTAAETEGAEDIAASGSSSEPSRGRAVGA